MGKTMVLGQLKQISRDLISTGKAGVVVHIYQSSQLWQEA
jgi:hypothetical protein